MGQTLTHGVYLPDEGERNCYSGLAANWQLLDNSVGTIAEHTTALAGKAPAVHTHTKSDITDFPAYGNAAGTICEGNDSRLSDARTPVAHTHTKSDVTDLLNSNFIPSANNSYDLGSSSYQWNNVYAKGYYYNGVAWGLDKANVWTKNNQFYGYVFSKGQPRSFKLGGYSSDEYGVQPQSTFASEIDFVDKNDTTQSYIIFQHRADATEAQRICFRVNRPQGEHYVSVNLNSNDELYPERNNAIDLGTSTNKWKSLNGINPGALSLPDSTTESFSGDLTNKGGSTSNKKTWTINGWGYVRITNTAGDFISVVATSACETYLTTGTGTGNDNIGVAFPIVSGREYSIYIKTSGSVVAYYMPTLGNIP